MTGNTKDITKAKKTSHEGSPTQKVRSDESSVAIPRRCSGADRRDEDHAMTKKRGRPITAEELFERLQADPEYVARIEARRAKVEALAKAISSSEAPLVADLRRLGFDVKSAWDLFNRKEPWRKDEPIRAWAEAVPVLIEHLNRCYPYNTREGIVRALTAPWGRVAFDQLVKEFRRTADPQVAAEEQRQAVDLVIARAGEFYSRDEAERVMGHRWNSFRFVLANAIGTHFEKQHVALMAGLLRDDRHDRDSQRTIADALLKKMRRWRRNDPEILTLAQQFATPPRKPRVRRKAGS